MPQQRSRTRAVIPGKAILGVAGAALADRKTLGGSVVPGPMITGDASRREVAAAAKLRGMEHKLDPKQATGPKPKPEVVNDALPPLIAASKRKPEADAPPPSFSEAEAVEQVETDPESWEHVLDLEMVRPDGMRPAVAAAILAVAPTCVENPVPEAAIEALKRIALEFDASAGAPRS